jgi:F-type H+-transporting ATPase subunit delta
MSHDPIAARYAQAAFEAAMAQDAVEATLESLDIIAALMREHADLRQLIRNPDVDPQDKAGVLDRLTQGTWSDLVRAFVRMVVSMGRAELLPDIEEAFRARVDAQRGRLAVVVRSARPVPEAALNRLRQRLEQRERKTIDLRAEVAPELLGGVQVVLGHRVIDGSVRRQLAELKQRLAAVRVY